MKGVVLAGGMGTRLMPSTMVTNKHLLPVYDRPMIYYPIQLLVKSGITEIVVVTGGNSAGHFFHLLKNGEAFGLDHLHYAYQEGSGGIAQALKLAKPFVGEDKMCVILGDNLIGGSVFEEKVQFEEQTEAARILLKEVPDSERFGVADFGQGGVLSAIVEKPEVPPSRFAVIGLYFYDSSVFDIISSLKPSGRGELEITDVNSEYLRRGELTYGVLNKEWTDAGTFESMFRASEMARRVVLSDNE